MFLEILPITKNIAYLWSLVVFIQCFLPMILVGFSNTLGVTDLSECLHWNCKWKCRMERRSAIDCDILDKLDNRRRFFIVFWSSYQIQRYRSPHYRSVSLSFGLLLENGFRAAQNRLPTIFLIITGKGPMKEYYLDKIARLNMGEVKVSTDLLPGM